MNSFPSIRPRLFALGTAALVALLAAAPTALQAQGCTKNPTGKIFVASVEGSAQIAHGDKVEALAVKGTFHAESSRIETKPKGNVAMVFSNGTGIFLDQDTHIDVKRFKQEAFVASRTDLEREPSISQTEVYLSSGTLAVSTSKLAAGSQMTFLTPLASVNVHDGNLVIEAVAGEVKISVLVGEATVRAGELDLGGKVLHAGEQAIIRGGSRGESASIVVDKIPAGERPALEDQAAMAYAARKTVFFDTDDTGEITAVPVVQTSVPVQATVSPSQLPK